MSDLNNFYGWLLKRKKYQESPAHDFISRLKRVGGSIDLEKNLSEDNLLVMLSQTWVNLNPSCTAFARNDWTIKGYTRD